MLSDYSLTIQISMGKIDSGRWLEDFMEMQIYVE